MTADDNRPNPDELLARLHVEAQQAARGKLRIFLGYAAGVGKTYAMLEAAHRLREEGIDVVVGYVEPHGRAETERLLTGLEVLPTLEVPYRGVTLRELDLDAALARHPQVLLVDELAHSNAEGMRHAKRWQDVEEVLAAGISVYTTLNIQHIESLNDVIAQVTGIVVRETLPDDVLEQANDFELIDITPEELLERLREGKVYLPEQAERALRHFFQRQNLTALRELSLRQAANRLRKDVDAAREGLRQSTPWATHERLLVCVGPSPTSARLIRSTKRMASALGAEWMAVAVEIPGRASSAQAKAQLAQHLRMAEQLGAGTYTLSGTRVADAVLEFAKKRNVTKIVVGKTAEHWWKRALRSGIVDDLLQRSGPIDVYVIRGEAEPGREQAAAAAPQPTVNWRKYLAATGIVAMAGIVAILGRAWHSAEANVVMVFLLAVAWVGYRYGRGPSIFASIASVLVFDFFFVLPYFTFRVADVQYLITFVVLLIIGLSISSLTVRLGEQLAVSRRQEHRTAALLQLTKQLSEVQGTDFLTALAGQRLAEIFDGEAVVYAFDDDNLRLRYGERNGIGQHPQSKVVAQWVAEHEQLAGLGTDTLPSAPGLFVPLVGSQRIVGSVGVRSRDETRLLDPEQRRLLTTCASLIALAIERDFSLVEAQQTHLKYQAEQLRTSLLSSVSHDLRTPLAAITGAASDLLRQASPADGRQRELLEMIVQESRRLNRLVENLLNMTRLESGAANPQKQWHVLEEVVGSALRRLEPDLKRHQVTVTLPVDLPLVYLDDLLIEQVLINLLENALRYTPPGSKIEIGAQQRAHAVIVTISDNGPGVPSGWEEKIFDKFVRGQETIPDGSRGAGLGLAICKAIVESHGGAIKARNLPSGGAAFVITLPHDPSAVPPAITA